MITYRAYCDPDVYSQRFMIKPFEKLEVPRQSTGEAKALAMFHKLCRENPPIGSRASARLERSDKWGATVVYKGEVQNGQWVIRGPFS